MGTRRALGLVAAWFVANFLVAVWFVTSARQAKPLFASHLLTLRMMASYGETVGLPWALGSGRSLLLVVAVAGTLGFGVWAVRRRDLSARRAETVAVLLFSLAALRGAMLRSDLRHIALGVMPLLLALLWVVPESKAGRIAWGAVLTLWVAGWPLSWGLLTANRLVEGRSVGPIAAIEADLAAGPAKVDRAELQSTATGLPRYVAAYPYDNRVGAILDRQLVTPIHQVHAAHTLGLQREFVGELDRLGSELAVVLAPDGLGAWSFDGGQTPTRSPLIFRYLLEHFVRSPERLLDGCCVVLRRSPGVRQLILAPVAYVARPQGRALRIEVTEPMPCPLYSLRVRLHYPWTRVLGWPAPVRLVARFGSHRIANSRIPRLNGDGSFETFLAAARPEELVRLFDREARPSARRVDSFRLVPESGGAFGVAADRVEVDAVACVSGALESSPRSAETRR